MVLAPFVFMSRQQEPRTSLRPVCASMSPYFRLRKVLTCSSVQIFTMANPCRLNAVQMATATESVPRKHLGEGPEEPLGSRTVPIITPTIQMSAPSPGDPMEITTPTNSSAPPSATKSPDSDVNVNGLGERERSHGHGHGPQNDQLSADNIIMPAPAAAAAAIHQPKIVQTAFIHKLYKYETLQGRVRDEC